VKHLKSVSERDRFLDKERDKKAVTLISEFPALIVLQRMSKELGSSVMFEVYTHHYCPLRERERKTFS
jgi:hypothetical protein